MFDEAAGDALDTGASSAANGKLVNQAGRTTNSPNGKGYALDLSCGTNGWVSAGNPPKLNNLTNFTLATWFNLQANPRMNDRLIDKLGSDSPNSGFGWKIEGPEKSGRPSASCFRLGLSVNDRITVALSSVDVSAASEWVFLAATYDGTTTNRNVAFYRGSQSDPVARVGELASLPQGPVINSASEFRIGGTAATTILRTPPAWFDDVRVYDTALSQADLEKIRQECLAIRRATP
jgi:hypothetical protein